MTRDFAGREISAPGRIACDDPRGWTPRKLAAIVEHVRRNQIGIALETLVDMQERLQDDGK